jgi:hypothetical protein
MIASENDIIYCQFHIWYKEFEKNTIKSEIIELPTSFIDYLKEDGINLPAIANNYFIRDDLSDDDEMVEKIEEPKQNDEVFFGIENKLQNILTKFSNAVFVKTNWSCPSDAMWINNNTLKCQTVSDIFLLLKSSDRTMFDLENMFDMCETKSTTEPENFVLVLRKWSNLHHSMEFRVFVFNKELIGFDLF